MQVLKGTVCFIVDKDMETTNCSINMDEDRQLNIGDVLEWQPSKHIKCLFKVVGFTKLDAIIARDQHYVKLRF